MTGRPERALWQTKTFWVGVVTICAGLIEGFFDGWQHGIDKILAGAALITGRDAIRKL